MSEDSKDNRAQIRRTTWTLALIALGFYVGFILVGVLRS
jgi:uncharacterized membrane protein (DUF485 family)